MKTNVLILSGLFFLIGGSLQAHPAKNSSKPKSVTIDIKNADGKTVGTATLSESSPGVKLTLDITNMAPGQHGFHIHKNAVCTPPDFKSAGPQFNPNGGMMPGHEHELPAGNPNQMELSVAADGTGHLSVEMPKLTMGEGDHSIFSNGGTAIIFHTVRGAPGENRVACGEIKKPE